MASVSEYILKHIFTDFGSFPCHVIFCRKSKGSRWVLCVAAVDKTGSHIR